MRSLFAALVLVGCATSRPVMTPSGAEGFYIECPRSQDLCMDEAAKVCPRGYFVIDAGAERGAIAQTYGQANGQAIGNYYTGQSSGRTVVTPTYRGNMTIECRQYVATLIFQDANGNRYSVPATAEARARAQQEGWVEVGRQ